MATNTANKQLFDLLVSKGFEPQILNAGGKPASSPEDAEVFSFDFQSTAGNDYGTVCIMVDSNNNIDMYFGDNIGSGMEPADKDEWFDFLYQIRMLARRNLMTFGIKNLNRLKYSMQGQAALKESWNGTKNTSFNGKPDSVRLMIKHNKDIGEGEQRFRHISKLFVETSDGERYLLPFTRLAGGRAMTQHVRNGGKPYDLAGQHIIEMVNELNVLSHYRRSQRGRVLEGDSELIMNDVNTYYENLQRSLKNISTNRGYRSYFESWQPETVTEQSAMIECLRTVLTNDVTEDSDLVLPVIAKATQEKTMKEFEIFEQWADTLTEGTWTTPDTPEKQAQLVDLLSRELPAGADGTNATEQLYDLLGDDELFDQIEQVSTEDPDSDVRPLVIARLQELSNIPDVKKVLDQVNTAASTPVEPAKPGGSVDAEGKIDESGMGEVDIILQDVARGDRDYSELVSAPQSATEKFAARELKRMYDDALTGGIAPDQAEKITLANIRKKYGIGSNLNESYYYEDLAQKLFDENPDFSTKGKAEELLDAGFRIAVQDLGKKRANWEFNYDEDFVGDLVSSYAYLQQGQQFDEGYRVVRDIDRERYTDLSDEGLEGPFQTNDGRVVYYDPQAGRYYDRDTDRYLDHDEVDMTESLCEDAQSLAYPHAAQEQDGYVPVSGLDGPYRYPNGTVLYYDRKKESYIDPGLGRYLTQDEVQNLHTNMANIPGEYETRGNLDEETSDYEYSASLEQILQRAGVGDEPRETPDYERSVTEDGYDDESLASILKHAGVDDQPPRQTPDYEQSVTEDDTGLADLTKISTKNLQSLYSVMKYSAETTHRDNPRALQAAQRAYEELRSRGLNIPAPSVEVEECCDDSDIEVVGQTVPTDAPSPQITAAELKKLSTPKLRELFRTINPNTGNPAEAELADTVSYELWRRGDHSPNSNGTGYEDDLVTLTLPADDLARLRDILGGRVDEINDQGWTDRADSEPESTYGLAEAPSTDLVAQLRRLSGQK